MDVFEAIKTRRSVRHYKPHPIPEEILKKVLEAARLAPSARNAQKRKFVIVKDPETRKQLAEAANNQDFIREAPVVIVAVALDPERIIGGEIPSYAVDLAIAIDHITLQATEEGLGTCWIGAFSQEKVKEILKIPPSYKVVTVMPLGWPADKPKPKTRKSLRQIVCYENFEE
ncbi:nitroreductase [Parcubacteria bacterium DG_74_3]|nr:MAG: nitroreductase [Parcubacteria bacterium DG_74_3]